jgi:hypothetical protein
MDGRGPGRSVVPPAGQHDGNGTPADRDGERRQQQVSRWPAWRERPGLDQRNPESRGDQGVPARGRDDDAARLQCAAVLSRRYRQRAAAHKDLDQAADAIRRLMNEHQGRSSEPLRERTKNARDSIKATA